MRLQGQRLFFLFVAIQIQIAPSLGYKNPSPAKGPHSAQNPESSRQRSSAPDLATDWGGLYVTEPPLTVDRIINSNPEADYRRIYKLKRGETPQSYLRAAYEAGLPNDRPSPDHPFSWLVYFNQPYVVDVTPDERDQSGRTFLMYIFNIHDFGNIPSSAPTNYVAEGPFKIQALHDSDEILLMQTARKPPAWLLLILPRNLQTFRVVEKGPGLFYIPEDTLGTDWLKGDSAAPRPVSLFLETGREWFIDAYPDQQVIGAFLVRVWCKGHYGSAIPRLRTNDWVTDGPWRILPKDPGGYFELRNVMQPPWFDEPNQFSRWGLPVPWLHSFKCMMSRQREVELRAEEERQDALERERERERSRRARHVLGELDRHLYHDEDDPDDGLRDIWRNAWQRMYAHHYMMQCTEMDIGYFVKPPTGYAKEFFIADGMVKAVPTDEFEPLDEAEVDPVNRVPDRIDVRVQGPGINRVIAQTVHTDHAEFMFEGQRESLATVFASLIFCVFSGASSHDVSISPYSR